MSIDTTNGQYAVLSPWAEADPIPLRGICRRVDGLAGKKIGLFANLKRAGKPILEAVEKDLRRRFPSAEISWYVSEKFNTPEIETENRGRFEEWIGSVDAIVSAVGD